MKKLIWVAAISLSVLIQNSAMAMEEEKENFSTRPLKSSQAKDDNHLKYRDVIKKLKNKINNLSRLSQISNIIPFSSQLVSYL